MIDQIQSEALHEDHRDVILDRATDMIGKAVIYKLGKGGRRPNATTCADINNMCDCSGFTAWCVGLDRYQPRSKLYVKHNGGWLSTDALVHDANQPKQLTGFFTKIDWPKAGDLICYGDHNGKQGHVGIVSLVGERGDWEALRVIHCSSGNYKKFKDAVRETDAGVFKKNPRTIFMRFDP